MVSMNGNRGAQSASVMEQWLRPLMNLEATYRAFAAAERELTHAIGIPICIPDCGRCCAVTTVMIGYLEAQFLVSSLVGGGGASALEKVLSRCEGWLLDRDPRLVTYGLNGILSQEQWDHLRPEVDYLMLTRPCPMLAEDKACLVHDARPLICRAYGLTRMPARFCPRPLSRLESEEIRAHISEHGPVGSKLKGMSQKVLAGGGVRFLPTALYAHFRAAKLTAFTADNLIATAKLVVLQQDTAILFQGHLDEVWRQASPSSPSRRKAPCGTLTAESTHQALSAR